jgi:hypothetical protein
MTYCPVSGSFAALSSEPFTLNDFFVNYPSLHCNPRLSVRQIGCQVHISWVHVWWALFTSGRSVSIPLPTCALSPARGFYSSIRFLSLDCETALACETRLVCDEVQFTHDRITNCHSTHVWSTNNPYHSIVRNFQHHFSVNVWCGHIVDKLIGPFILVGCLTADYYLHILQNKLPLILEGVLLQARLKMGLQHDSAPPYFGCQSGLGSGSQLQVTQFLNWCRNFCKSHCSWIGAVEIIGLVVEVRMPGHSVLHTRLPFIYTCEDAWRTWCNRRNRRHENS